MEKTLPFEPDAVGHNSAPYWGAVLAQAVRDRDDTRAQTARAELRRLRCNLAWRPRRTLGPEGQR
ncbi:MAG: hypothetical protein ACP5I8_16485 [Phycisphaerae bacterium]